MRINPKDSAYGAVGDGVADDRNAILSAIIALPLRGGVIDLDGDFKISSPLPAINKSVYIIGTGRGCSAIIATGDFDVLSFDGFTGGWAVKDIEIRGPNGAVGAAIRAVNAPYGEVAGLTLSGTGTGVALRGAQGTIVEKSTIWGFSQYGILLDGNANNDIYLGKLFINGQTLNGQAGLGHGVRLVDKCEAIFCEGLEVILCDYPMSMDAAINTVSNRPAYLRFSSCFFDSCAHPALVNKAVDVVFMGCEFANRPGSGVVVVNSDGVTFIASMLGNSAQHGAIVDASAGHVTFAFCNIVGNSSQAVGAFHGIVTGGGIKDFAAVGNNVFNGWGFSGQQGVGISMMSGASDRYLLTNNRVIGNHTVGLSDLGTGGNKSVGPNV